MRADLDALTGVVQRLADRSEKAIARLEPLG
jgi:hypothetical protein